MVEKGQVLKTEDNIAYVVIPRKSACGDNCAMCKGGCSGKGHSARVENAVGARAGDIVRIFTNDGAVMKSIILVYFLPLLVFFIAYAVAFSLSEKGSIAAFVGIFFFILSFFILKIFDKNLAPKPRITEILSVGRKDDSHGI